MKWLLLIPAIVVFGLVVLLIFGLLQPVKHSVTRSIHLKQRPDIVFALLDNSTNLPNWSSSVMKVEPAPDQDGKPAVRCTLRCGGIQLIATQLERTPPTRLVVRMAKDGGPVLGTWTYQLAAAPDGCQVALTEQGELKNPLFRAMARMRGLDANIIQTLQDLAKNFGESADVQRTL